MKLYCQSTEQCIEFYENFRDKQKEQFNKSIKNIDEEANLLETRISELSLKLSQIDPKDTIKTDKIFDELESKKSEQEEIEKIKKGKITKLENTLTKDKQRLRTSNNYRKFNEFVILKMKIHNELLNLYNDPKLNKLKWFSFINEKDIGLFS